MPRLILLLFVFAVLLYLAALTASAALEPSSIGPAVAPDPKAYPDAVVQVYGADVWGLRGRFAIHTWIATKGINEPTYTIYQVIGWQLRRTGSAVSVTQGRPDKPWFRSPPVLLHEVRGAAAARLIPQIAQSASAYPYAEEYTMWPGPNSNSFIAWIALEVPDLGLTLPAKAIGKNWMRDNHVTTNGQPVKGSANLSRSR